MLNTTITDAEKKNTAFENIIGREYEIEHYQVNIDNYTAILLALPVLWLAELEQYKGFTSQQIAEQVPLGDVELVSDLLFRDAVEKSLRTEMIEQRKAKYIYNALLSQQDVNTLEVDLIAAKTAYELKKEAVQVV